MVQAPARVTEPEIRKCIANGAASSAYWRGAQMASLQTISTLRSSIDPIPRFLHRIRMETNDKIVLISNYTQTLDLFEKMLRSKK